MRNIRVGVIGLGEVAQIIHLPILQALSARYTIAAICDVSPTLLSTMGDRYGIALDARHADYRDLVARNDLVAVFVLNSDEYHANCTTAAAIRGKHVLVEKPMCLTLREAYEIIAARDQHGVQVMVAYMRRFAPALLLAVEEVQRIGKINYVRVRDIIGRNRLIIDQSSAVIRPQDIPAGMSSDRAERAARLVREAAGDLPPQLVRCYRLLCGLSSHDLSAMRELIGSPRSVKSAVHWNEGNFMHVLFEYDGYYAALETGIDDQVRFDAHIEIYGATKSVRVQYDTPYIRHLPTTLVTTETNGDRFTETVVRPTYKDPYTHELEVFHRVATGEIEPKTTPEDFIEDLRIFHEIIDVMRADLR